MQAEEALALSEMKYRTVAEFTWDWEFWLGNDRQFLYVSPSCQRISGYSPAAFLEDAGLLLRTVRAADRSRVAASLENAFKGGVEEGIDFRILGRDRRSRWVSLAFQPVIDQDGRHQGVRGSIRDIDERKSAETKLLEYQQRLRELASRLSLTQERERKLLAKGLHDGIGQSLALARLRLGRLQEELVSSPTMAEAVVAVRALIEDTIQETRDLTFELSPPILYEVGFSAAAEWLAEVMQRKYGYSCRIEASRRVGRLPDDLAVELFATIRELLVNVGKHAKARQVTIGIERRGEMIRIRVRDDGVGFELQKDAGRGFGLFNARECLGILGGTLKITSTPGAGVDVLVTAPVKPRTIRASGGARGSAPGLAVSESGLQKEPRR